MEGNTNLRFYARQVSASGICLVLSRGALRSGAVSLCRKRQSGKRQEHFALDIDQGKLRDAHFGFYFFLGDYAASPVPDTDIVMAHAREPATPLFGKLPVWGEIVYDRFWFHHEIIEPVNLAAVTWIHAYWSRLPGSEHLHEALAHYTTDYQLLRGNRSPQCRGLHYPDAQATIPVTYQRALLGFMQAQPAEVWPGGSRLENMVVTCQPLEIIQRIFNHYLGLRDWEKYFPEGSVKNELRAKRFPWLAEIESPDKLKLYAEGAAAAVKEGCADSVLYFPGELARATQLFMPPIDVRSLTDLPAED